MKKDITLGCESFEELMHLNGYFVDKSELIYELTRKKNKVTLFTRPRRFGKTLTMSMIESFFSNQADSKELFRDLRIVQNHPAFCEEWLNQYPVLRISLKDVSGLEFESAYKILKATLADLCKKWPKLSECPEVNPADAEIFQRLMYKTEDLEETQASLKTIMRMLYAVYGKQVILLIDEYDVPLAKAHANGYYREMLEVIRGLMSASLKTNDFLKFAVVTGCLRIPKESLFTRVNNFAAYSVLDEEFSEYFGFTPQEVEELLNYYHREDKLGLAAEWYDGYSFGGTEIYCPWDVMSYVSALRGKASAKPKSYWENTSGNDAFRGFFDLGTDDISEKFEILLNGGTITEPVTNALSYDEVYDSESNLWSVLLMTGYLTPAKKDAKATDESDTTDGDREEDEDRSLIDLRIPNKEISRIFQHAVVDQFNRSVDQSRIDEMMTALWSGEEEKASAILSDLLFETISYMDYHEDYYHAFVAGIFKGRGYSPKSNREQGLGRSDVNLRDRKNRRAMIIEMKKADREEDLEKACDIGIEQIRKRQYARDTEGYKLSKNGHVQDDEKRE